MLGGFADAAFARAARHGDGWTGGNCTLEELADGTARLRAAWEAAEREGTPRTIVQPYYALGSGAEQAVERCLGDYYGSEGAYTDTIVARAATDAETVRENVEAFAQAGCDELIFFVDRIGAGRPARGRAPVTEFATYPSLRGQVAFVSGGATGLGAEFVAQFAAQGVRVGFVDVRDAAGEALVETLLQRGHPEPLYQHCDVCDVAALQNAIAATGEPGR